MDEYGAAGIGERVRAYRRAAGLTADQLAAKVEGLTGNAVAKLENGHRREVSTELLVQLAWALQVPPLVLLFPLQDPNAVLSVGDVSGTPETLGYWIQGLPVPESDVSTATKLGNAVHSEHRRLVINALDLLNDVATQLTEQGTLAPGADQTIQQRSGLSAEGLAHGRQSLWLLRDRLGLEDG